MAQRPGSQAGSYVSSMTTTLGGGHENHHTWAPYRGPVQFTGPSGLRDYRSHLPDFPHAVGEGDRSNETTSDLAYLSRRPPGSAFPLAKNGRSGEIGWPVDTFRIVKGL